jgi:Barrel-sandwich domain of CusB or HlyD membrane-fusion
MTQALWDLSRKARQAGSDRELGFLLVNETLALVPYRQAALWLAEEGAWSLSGVVQVVAHVPFVQWFEAVCRHLQQQATEASGPMAFSAADLPVELAADWAQWWPAHALWLPSEPGASGSGGSPALKGAAVLLRDTPWTEEELALLHEWSGVWWHAFAALHRPRLSRWRGWHGWLARALSWHGDRPWWRQRRMQWLALVLAVLLFPVRLTVLAQGELVPANPTVVRAPLDGVIDVFHVQPNQQVQAGQALFSFDEIVIGSRLEVAMQALATAETDYRQTSQLALSDARAKAQLALLLGKVEERRAEIDYLQEQLTRARVLAPQPGVVLMDDPSEWIGKPVATGERILRLAALDDVEVEAWVPIADAIRFEPDAQVSLYLSASPLSPVSARLRYMAHDAVQRPDGGFAYRVRATLTYKTEHRVGLKGTAKLQGGWAPLAYWVLRRPWATLRATLGW